MSKVFHDFKCPEGHVTEQYVHRDTTESPCEVCGLLAKRVFLVAPRVDWLSLGASRFASPEAIQRWDRMHKEQKDKEERSLAEHGDYGPRPGAD
jgi:hypothetical protein